MPASGSYTMSVRITGTRPAEAGLLIDLAILIEDGEDKQRGPAWEGVLTFISRGKRKGPRKPRAAKEQVQWQHSMEFRVAGDTGRRYAPVSGDYNPHHLYAVFGKLFGFPRAIAQGMWYLSSTLAETQKLKLYPAAFPVSVEADFKRPVLLPSKVVLKCGKEQEETRFLLESDKGVPHLSGRVFQGTF